MKNFISENITYLVKEKKGTQDDFGLIFDLKKGVINQYIQGKSNPKIETIQKICDHFDILIDDFINRPLSEAGNFVRETKPSYGHETELLKLKDEVISLQKNEIERLKEKIETLSKSGDSKTA